MSRTHKFPFSIAYADTDAGGIVYHGRYIEIAERARMHWLRGVVFPDGDLGFVVRELSVRYLQPLRLGDDFVVESVITEIGAASMDIEQKFVKGDDVCAIMNIKIAYLGNNMRPKRIPESILDALAS
ncbi:4-hydroxybenzoyl-CoA thioesterase [bacterium]|nr:4-hydroxybenzoyl-CoA thioesterase [bacterium]